jgi:hypothetical protein
MFFILFLDAAVTHFSLGERGSEGMKWPHLVPLFYFTDILFAHPTAANT